MLLCFSFLLCYKIVLHQYYYSSNISIASVIEAALHLCPYPAQVNLLTGNKGFAHTVADIYCVIIIRLGCHLFLITYLFQMNMRKHSTVG